MAETKSFTKKNLVAPYQTHPQRMKRKKIKVPRTRQQLLLFYSSGQQHFFYFGFGVLLTFTKLLSFIAWNLPSMQCFGYSSPISSILSLFSWISKAFGAEIFWASLELFIVKGRNSSGFKLLLQD